MQVPKEAQEQANVVEFAERLRLPIYSIPNGFHVQGASVQAHQREMAKLKWTGLRTGVPDLCIARAAGGYHGLYIEMKRQKGGHVSEDQERWLSVLRDEGYYTAVCKGYDEAKKVIVDYMKGEITRG